MQVDDGVGEEYLLQQDHLKGVKRASKMGKVIFVRERKLLGPCLPVVLSRQMFLVLFCHFIFQAGGTQSSGLGFLCWCVAFLVLLAPFLGMEHADIL